MPRQDTWRSYPHTGSATQGTRWRAFHTICSASEAGCVRLCHRALGADISAVQRRHIRVVGSIDMTLNSTRRQCDGSRAWVHRWEHCGVEVVTSGLLNGGNLAGIATRAQSRGELGEDALTGGSQVAATVAREW
jgi:hypothetical protein